eukprot:TRINITY_DN22301_c0_g1_i1.p1 TRINITY_DN22301_c0_g1~~TRINITY_DN22301_c0_g1_i1.p1  ORF type:complete len:184 (+),score=32.34 TRINITY_DN22301_c0_g1_i1:184-735(+)
MSVSVVTVSFDGMKKRKRAEFPAEFPVKKHIKNARELERNRRKELIYQTINSWITSDHEPIEHEQLADYLGCIKQLCQLMGYHFKSNLLLPSVIYADKYVHTVGTLDRDQVFHLLLTSALVAIKFWEDEGVDIELTCEIFGIDRKYFVQLEKDFLITLDYELMLSTKDIETFAHANMPAQTCA